MSNQLKSLKQLIKHAVNPVKILTNDLLAQEPVSFNTSPNNSPTFKIIDIPSPYPQPIFIDLDATLVEVSRAEINQASVEASRQIEKPIPRPRAIRKRPTTPIEISVDPEISFAIRLEL